jgi:hypothetical protein
MTKKKTLQTVSTVGNAFGLAVSLVPFFGGFTLPFPFVETIRNALVISQSIMNLSVGILKKNKPVIIENSLVMALSVPMGMFGMMRFTQRQRALSKSFDAFTLQEHRVLSRFEEGEEENVLLNTQGRKDSSRDETDALHKHHTGEEQSLLRQSGEGGSSETLRRMSSDDEKQPEQALQTFSPERQHVSQEQQEEREQLLPRHVNKPTQELRKKMTSMLGRFALAEDDVKQATSFLSKEYSLNKSLNRMGAIPDMAKNITMFDRSDLSQYEDEINTLLKENIFFQTDDERKSYLYWYMRQINRLVSPIHSALNLALTK